MSCVVGGDSALGKGGEAVAGGGGKRGEGRMLVILAPQVWGGPITYRTECPLGGVEAEEP